MWHIKSFTFNPLQQNTYVVYNHKNKAIIIDPGCYFTAEEKELESFIQLHDLQVVYLINTHCHLDHVFGNKWAFEKYKQPLHIHTLEEKVLAFAPISGQSWGLPFSNYEGPLEFLKENTSLFVDEDELQLLLTPGHSPGSLCFYCPQQNFVIAGDVLFRESIGRTDLPGGSHQHLINSIKTQLYTLPNETVIYNGHGNATTIGHEKQHNPYVKG
jgi:hydroxyacylglutathione hydrolase